MAEVIAPKHSGGSMFGRIAWIVVTGFLLIHAIGYYFYGHERMVDTASTYAVSVAQRSFEVGELLQKQPELLPHLNTQDYQIKLSPEAAPQTSNRWPHSGEVEAAVKTRLVALGMTDLSAVRMAYVGGRVPRFELTIPAQKGGFLQVVARTNAIGRGYGSPASFSTSVLLLLVIAAVLFTTRRTTRQLERVVYAATALGEGQASDVLPEDIGPKELRRVSAAFNAMQARVMKLLSERSAMLAGVSHDLRTLCTRLGLRIEELPDPVQKDKAQQDVELMTEILDQALIFARDEHSEEKFQAVDLSSLLHSIVSEQQDLDVSITFEQLGQPIVQAQYVAVRRLFNNLVDNAIKYGGSAKVILRDGRASIVDPGAGIDREEVDIALQPYARLEKARSQGQPGTGLGLSIARNICQRHDWQLTFCHLDNGFEVAVDFSG